MHTRIKLPALIQIMAAVLPGLLHRHGRHRHLLPARQLIEFPEKGGDILHGLYQVPAHPHHAGHGCTGGNTRDCHSRQQVVTAPVRVGKLDRPRPVTLTIAFSALGRSRDELRLSQAQKRSSTTASRSPAGVSTVSRVPGSQCVIMTIPMQTLVLKSGDQAVEETRPTVCLPARMGQ